MKFDTKYLIEEVVYNSEVKEEIVEQTRWHILYRKVFEFENKFYETYYRLGATEYQSDELYDFDEEECEEVFPVEVKITKYLTQKQIDKFK